MSVIRSTNLENQANHPLELIQHEVGFNRVEINVSLFLARWSAELFINLVTKAKILILEQTPTKVSILPLCNFNTDNTNLLLG